MIVARGSDRPLPMAAILDGDDVRVAIKAPAVPVDGSALLRKVAGVLEDAVLLVIAVFLLPLGILLIGTPIAVGVRILVAIAHRL